MQDQQVRTRRIRLLYLLGLDHSPILQLETPFRQELGYKLVGHFQLLYSLHHHFPLKLIRNADVVGNPLLSSLHLKSNDSHFPIIEFPFLVKILTGVVTLLGRQVLAYIFLAVHENLGVVFFAQELVDLLHISDPET